MNVRLVISWVMDALQMDRLLPPCHLSQLLIVVILPVTHYGSGF